MPPKRRSSRLSGNPPSSESPTKSQASTAAAAPKPSSDTNNIGKDDDVSALGSTTSPPSTKTTGNMTATPRFTSYEVPSKTKPIPCLRSHPPGSPPASLIFTHGAGGGLSAPAVMNFSHGFASTGAAIVCFQGNMNLKGRAGMFAAVLDYEKQQQQQQQQQKTGETTGDSARPSNLAFGGRSMGARAAVLAAHDRQAQAIRLLVLVSYPLIGPNRDVRDQILLDINPGTDVLFISGDGDSMCDFGLLAKVRAKMKARSWLVTVKGADHGMNLKGGAKLKKGTEEIGKETGRIAATWIRERDEGIRDMVLEWDSGRQRVVGNWGNGKRDGLQVAHGRDTGAGAASSGGIERYLTTKREKGDEAEVDEPSPKRKKREK
ncbi:hypothetical protein HRR83_009105 [Exophiala dermatitidis]|uniref:KANL3/Tex30 alpha/beta hydrolase-like domain-containing protein n=2 Tax=Exophiala dermatitidis TaxID=5970 RepID=H6BX19_EXODN|nr:uncharacterized protein HMPREF1120_03447 [Exophiala dermatitidis NIH/UT8656]KAJ4503143.1 hypothetical protein HRR73_009154 [Exophiala dermatitidis]EHY55305.1 hypothetical protein HMPREF1120_03447 [Exophiala dermatitidis NIH/UT8656]KAJ4506187.1 hypothetical protein HRR75_007042 [Exophiala dermatitidis]KAJ4508279.1 hypothetical protein HRR74_007678 [Exophiala dermatitidis]KAJ4533283.1 hypothetical protein HRR77_008813 [Exophiala dermatitidis]